MMPQRKGGSDTATIKGLCQIPLTNCHRDAACALVAEAGWNQTVDDWRMMIHSGEAIGFEVSYSPFVERDFGSFCVRLPCRR